MIDYYHMEYGYSLDINITDNCNLCCKHCYMSKTSRSLEKKDVQTIFNKLPGSLNRIVISGGEPFLNEDVIYEICDVVRSRFKSAPTIRITSNGTLFYNSDSEIINTLNKLQSAGVDQLRLSSDKYHLDAGVNADKLARIGEIAQQIGLKMSVDYLDIALGALVGNNKHNISEPFCKKECLNKKDNTYKPYLFMNTDGALYHCAFRSTPPLGNLLTDSWLSIANNIRLNSANFSGDMLRIVLSTCKNTNEVIHDYTLYGECYVCEKYYSRKE